MNALLKPRTPFPYVAAGVIVDEGEAHICVLADDGWPHYTSVALGDPARWRKALATLADPATPTMGKHRRPPLRKPVWLGVQAIDRDLSPRLLALVLLPKGRVSVVPAQTIDDYRDRLGLDPGCRFDRAELLANYVLRIRPAIDERIVDAAEAIGLSSVRSRARG